MADDGSAFPIEHERMLATLLDVVVPPSEDGRLPGAGALGLTDHVLRTVEQTPMLGPVVTYGLSALADLAVTRNRGGWDGLSPDERAARLVVMRVEIRVLARRGRRTPSATRWTPATSACWTWFAGADRSIDATDRCANASRRRGARVATGAF